jgi:hypothetical protein
MEPEPPVPIPDPLPTPEPVSWPDPLPPEVPRPDVDPPGTGVALIEPLPCMRVEFEPEPIEPDELPEPVPVPDEPVLLPPLAPPVCAWMGNVMARSPETAQITSFFIFVPLNASTFGACWVARQCHQANLT